MGRYYKILSIKKAGQWDGSYGKMQDYALALKGIGEPVKLSLTEPIIAEPQVGQELYGQLTEETAKESKRKYYRFTIQPIPDADKRQANINSQWAIGQAVQLYIAGDYETVQMRNSAYDNIEAEARHFYQMINKVIGE